MNTVTVEQLYHAYIEPIPMADQLRLIALFSANANSRVAENDAVAPDIAKGRSQVNRVDESAFSPSNGTACDSQRQKPAGIRGLGRGDLEWR